MLTRIEASFSDAVTVEVEPTADAESTLSTRAGHVSVRLAPGAALAVTLPDGTSALAPVDGTPHRFEAVIGLTLLGPEATATTAPSVMALTPHPADGADSTVLVSDLRAALDEYTDDTLVGLDVLSAALDRGHEPPSALALDHQDGAAHDDATVSVGRQRGRRAAAEAPPSQPKTPRSQRSSPGAPAPSPGDAAPAGSTAGEGEGGSALSLDRPTLSHATLGALPPTPGGQAAAGAPSPEAATGLSSEAGAAAGQAAGPADPGSEAEIDADATTVAPRGLLAAAAASASVGNWALTGQASAPATPAPIAFAPGFTPPAPAAGHPASHPAPAPGAVSAPGAEEDPDLTTVRAALPPASPEPAQAPAGAPTVSTEDPDATTVATRAALLAGTATPPAPAATLLHPPAQPDPATSGTEDPDLTTLGQHKGRQARVAPAHRVPAPLAAEAAPGPDPHGTALLVQDAHGTREVPLAGTVVIGRTPSPAQVRERDARGLTVVPTGTGVSHSHAAIRRQGSVVLVRDLWSTNGTRVRSAGVPPFRLRDGEEVPVSDGTVVELGDGVVITIVERGEG